MTTPAGAAELTLAPVALDAFLADHWDRRPLRVPRAEPGRFDGVLSLADAEAMVSSGGLRSPAFRLVKDGAQLPLAGYTETIAWRPGSFSGLALVDRVAAEVERGATLVLQALQLHWPPAALYCRGLEQALGCPVQANAYWTPPAAQGFAAHHDTHDVFVLQVGGRKRWRVYEPVLELPLKDQRWSASLGEVGEPVDDFVLEPGDTLYLPRGWPHEAETASETSLHVTVGLHPQTRLDALRAALEACGDDVEFRRALAPDGALPADLLDRLARRLTPADVAARARRRFVGRLRPVLDGQLSEAAEAAALALDTPLARRATVIADVERGVLRFEGKEVAFPPQAHAPLAWIHARDAPFSAGDVPGPLDAAGRLVLVRRLVREGYLRRAQS